MNPIEGTRKQAGQNEGHIVRILDSGVPTRALNYEPLIGTILRTILIFKMDPDVHCQGSRPKAKIDSSSYGRFHKQGDPT